MTNVLMKRLLALTIGLAMLASFGAVMMTTPTETVDAQAACGLLWDAKYYNDRELGTAGGQLIWVECLAPTTSGGLSTTFDSAAIPDNNFSAEIERNVQFSDGTYQFSATFEDGIRLYVGTELVIDEWTLYPGPRTVTGNVFIGGVPQSVKVEFMNGNGGNARLDVSWSLQSAGGSTSTPSGGGGGGGGGGGTGATATPTCDDTVSFTLPWIATYYITTDFTGDIYLLEKFGEGKPLVRSWTGSPGGLVPDDNWSAIFTREVEFPITSTIEFSMGIDDIATLYLDGTPIIASHTYYTGETYTSLTDVAKGTHSIEVRFTEFIGDAYVNVTWTNAENGGGGACATTGGGGGNVNSPTGIKATVTANAGLNYRECPDLNCTKLGKLDLGTVWPVLGRTADGVWTNLVVNNQSVWALTEWLSFDGDFASLPITWDNGFEPPLPNGVPIRAVGNVKIRECPALNCARITYVPWGSRVYATGTNSKGNWLLIGYEDPDLGLVIGWSYALWYYNDDFSLPLPELPVVAE